MAAYHANAWAPVRRESLWRARLNRNASQPCSRNVSTYPGVGDFESSSVIERPWLQITAPMASFGPSIPRGPLSSMNATCAWSGPASPNDSAIRFNKRAKARRYRRKEQGHCRCSGECAQTPWPCFGSCCVTGGRHVDIAVASLRDRGGGGLNDAV